MSMEFKTYSAYDLLEQSVLKRAYLYTKENIAAKPQGGCDQIAS